MATAKKSQKDLIQDVLQSYRTLKQAAADASYWRERFLQQAEQARDQALVGIEQDHDQALSQGRAEFEAQASEFHRAADQAREALGTFAAGWESPLWPSFDPALRNGVPSIPDPLTGLEPLLSGYAKTSAIPGGVRVGTVVPPQLGLPLEVPMLDVPALVPLTGHGHILIVSEGAAKNAALILLQSVVTRIALTFPVLSARFVMIDPLGLGDNFPFKRLPESIRGNTVYSEPDEIRVQMRELTEHLRRVTLKYLAREYDNIEAYNRDAEEVVEPYRFLCVADFPSKFDGDAATRLLSVAERGVRTGVYIVMHVNADASLPRDFDFDALKRTATVIHTTPNGFTFPMLGTTYTFRPDDIPDSDLFNTLMDRVSIQAEYGAFKGIPFEKVAPPPEAWWSADSRTVIETPIGRTGARDILTCWLGKQKDGRISSHALVGGKTGSGKSTLFHVLINSLALKYSPDELQLYLVDFKEGVEFKPYADAHLPHAHVIAIESEREFGLSVLDNLQAELERRGALFKQADAQDLTTYRDRTSGVLPRIVLIIDEFQVLFAEQDAISNRAAQVLEDLVRRGRAFGIHVIMGSQSVKVANLPKAAYGQFATRVVLQAPEDDVAALLGPDNIAAAEILERPGEVIYNDDGGRRDRNQPGQVAILRDEGIPRILQHINNLAQKYSYQRIEPQIVFRGNEASCLDDNRYLQQLYDLADWPSAREIRQLFGLRDWIAAERPSLAWLGEAIEIKPHTAAVFRRQSRSNLLVVGDSEETIFDMLGGALISLAAFYRPNDVQFRLIDMSLKEEAWEDTFENFAKHFSFFDIAVEERRGAADLLDQVAATVEQRQEQYRQGDEDLGLSIFFVVAGIQRLPTLRPMPGRLGRDEPSEYGSKLMQIIQYGPELGVHTILWCDSAKAFDTIMGGKMALAHFDRRVALPMSRDDSQYLLRELAASTLQAHRAYLLNDEQNVPLEKFKPYALAEEKAERERQIFAYAERLKHRLEAVNGT